jgi:hypothetical protein
VVGIPDLRRARYIGLAKTRLQHLLTATGLNVLRLGAWWADRQLARSRTSLLRDYLPPWQLLADQLEFTSSVFHVNRCLEDTSGGSGEFYVWGNGRLVTDAATRALAVQASSCQPADRYILFELDVDRARGTMYSEDGPLHQSWSA